ncbi:EamA family transporter [Candidatus Parcubacteria bacterium]|nr:EamA family transporter [Candidatus Parcubacteria bacterium]
MNIFALHILAIIFLDIAGTLSAKLYSINRNPLLLLATSLLFGATGYVFARSLRYEGMAITNILWISLSIILMTIVGYFIFKEDITHIQFIGIGAIAIGLILVNLE